MKELRSEIDIDASAERVWDVLTDFSSYPEWNPYIKSIAGEAREGARLAVRLEPPGGPGMTFKPTVKSADAAREFRWLGRLLLPRLFDGEHIFELRAKDEGGARLVQREEVSRCAGQPPAALGREKHPARVRGDERRAQGSRRGCGRLIAIGRWSYTTARTSRPAAAARSSAWTGCGQRRALCDER